MELETELIAECARTADAQEGMAAFLGKRAPKFTGR
jgi:enoyl-CoA hydratase/carnithine racemase